MTLQEIEKLGQEVKALRERADKQDGRIEIMEGLLRALSEGGPPPTLPQVPGPAA